MDKIAGWLKTNWLVVILGLTVIYLMTRNNGVTMYGRTTMVDSIGSSEIAHSPSYAPSAKMGMTTQYNMATPTDTTNRMVTQDTSLSMQVNDVGNTIKDIEKAAAGNGGYMVNRNLSKPEGASSGYIVIRVPSEKREAVIDGIKTLGIKVVSENVIGDDVTDEYVDIDSRIANLQKTKEKMEKIMDQADKAGDLLEIQNQINMIQQQIDSLKGQQKYLEQTAKLSRISVNLSTDDLALPYTPDTAWRPAVEFKKAVRSLISVTRNTANFVIWIVVFAPVWALIILAVWIAKKLMIKVSGKQ